MGNVKRRLSDAPNDRAKKRRIHEDEIWEREEFKAAQVDGRRMLAKALENTRQEYFGFLTQQENNRIKSVIQMIVRRAS